MKGELATYLDYVILGQLIPAMNTPGNIGEYECKPKEVKLVTTLYNVDSGKFLGLDKRLAFIMVELTKLKYFFLTALIKPNRKSFILLLKRYCRRSTCRSTFIQKYLSQKTSKLFSRTTDETRSSHLFYLPSTTDRSHDINQFKKKSFFAPY